MKPLVSAVITTHNRKDLLKRAIDSVFTQTYQPIELIVVDDASDDGTRDEFGANAKFQYIYVPQRESKGGNYARNLGIKASKGKYCAFLDDDDYWLPTKIEKQVQLIEQRNCDLVYCGRRNELVGKSDVRYVDRPPKPHNCGDVSRKILRSIFVTTSTMLIKRESLLDIGMFDENVRFWQEYELAIRLAQRSPFYFVNEALVVYRIDKTDKNRLTNKYYKWKESVRYIRKKHQMLYKDLKFVEKQKSYWLIWHDGKIRSRAEKLYIRYCLYIFLLMPSFLYNKFIANRE